VRRSAVVPAAPSPRPGASPRLRHRPTLVSHANTSRPISHARRATHPDTACGCTTRPPAPWPAVLPAPADRHVRAGPNPARTCQCSRATHHRALWRPARLARATPQQPL
jgi:hypothetical protein